MILRNMTRIKQLMLTKKPVWMLVVVLAILLVLGLFNRPVSMFNSSVVLTDNRALEKKEQSSWQTVINPVKQCTNQQRQQALKQVCQENPNLGRANTNVKANLDHFMVDDKNKVLYCFIAKAGCSSWKHLMALASGKVTAETLQKDWNIVHERPLESKLGLHRLPSYSAEAIQYRLTNYTKFLIARNPLDRLYSAYNDKFIWFYDRYAKVYYKDILKQLYPDLPVIEGRPFLSWSRFVDMIIRAYQKQEQFLALATYDEHWTAVHRYCHPCSIHFDYIGKVETMERDQESLLKLFKATELPLVHNITLDELQHSNVFNHTRPSLEQAYSEISNEAMNALNEIFSGDLKLFGYQGGYEPTCLYPQMNCC